MAITGYPSATSVGPGELINFHLSSDSPGLHNLVVERIGIGPIRVSQSITANVSNQPIPIPEKSPWEGYGWSATMSFKVPTTWPTGLYRLADGTADVFTFVVRPERRGATSKVLLHVPFLTATAYNNAGPEGGRKSLYGYNSDPDGTEASRATKVSLDRPGSTPGSSAGEAGLIFWLEIEKVAVEYCSSVDLHTIPNLLADY